MAGLLTQPLDRHGSVPFRLVFPSLETLMVFFQQASLKTDRVSSRCLYWKLGDPASQATAVGSLG